MTINKNNAKARIMDVAQDLILQKGYSATSIDEILAAAHITKGGFFYHFKGKNELALALVERYLEADNAFFAELFDRADSLSEDPLQQMLIFLKLLAEAMSDLPNGHPGCLVASFIYESLQFEKVVLDHVTAGVLEWRSLFEQRLALIADKYPMKVEQSTQELADMLTVVIEGAIVLVMSLKDRHILSKQILLYRDHLRMLFGDV